MKKETYSMNIMHTYFHCWKDLMLIESPKTRAISKFRLLYIILHSLVGWFTSIWAVVQYLALVNEPVNGCSKRGIHAAK